MDKLCNFTLVVYLEFHDTDLIGRERLKEGDGESRGEEEEG